MYTFCNVGRVSDSVYAVRVKYSYRLQGGAIRDKLLRDLVVGPTAEEWVFRACM